MLLGTALLLLPAARSGPGSASPLEALFTATSAVCVTGLAVVDTAGYWSGFGQAVILVLIQVGGFGIMTLASLLGLLVSRRIGVRSRVTAAAETRTPGLGDVRAVLVGVAALSLVVESVTAALLTARFALGYGEPLPRALWLGVFHAVSAFNNAGFALYSDSLVGFVTDPWICLPVAAAVIVGALGFPVLLELRRELRRPRAWSLHTQVTVVGTAVLVVSGTAFMLVTEWSNPGTLGPLGVPGKLLAGFFQGVMPRTAGFNSVDVAAMNTGTWLGTDVLMFIGGGSAGTAGGIKITTFAVLLFAIVSEVRGDDDTTALGRRRLPVGAQRQALSVALLGVAAVALPAVVFALTTPFTLDQILYEVVSAFATVGLSTGITAQLSAPHQLALVVLMFVGRTGTITLASALALRSRKRLYRLPEERTVIG
ncbi:MAG: KtrAB potassium uptake system, integral membrane component KtrB [uncultured Quadrisphaera sp.]|uniref:KtrAB potassium uptake system, integral membrane component KtrB n=1 Tax=uncultured Quadrisphaera sp. TaxID=904978 RepID=A0A6J4PM79_9ACTN|nr:MAG: KtrAB potassium uptake system, integral membrane component KtrB [uncultured Quadrisphaera sp.]